MDAQLAKALGGIFIASCLTFFGAEIAVAKAIKITALSYLDFGIAVQGDPAKVVPPGTYENSNNGSFKVTGDAYRAYTLVLPANTVNLITGAGGAGRTLAIRNFTSYPGVGGNGVLDANGEQTVFVGATRDAIGWSQNPGTYSGSYVITVVY